MMSLTKVRLWDVVKQQYRYKLKGYIQVFMSMVVLQVLALIFSLNGVGNAGASGGLLNVNTSYFSADFVLAFTMLWGFITAILITTKAYSNDDFIFVTNRLSSHLSNVLFLVTASILGGLTTILSTFLLKVIVFLFKSDVYLASSADLAAPMTLLVGVSSASLYILLLCSLGYLVGTLIQWSKLFAVLLPAVFVGGLLLNALSGEAGILAVLYAFFMTESSFPLFFLKVVCTSVVLFWGAFGLSNRLEVRP